MNIRRIALIMLFELRHGIVSARGLLFLLPFALLWYPLLRAFDSEVSAWFREGEGIVAAALLLDLDLAQTLFREHPPVLSVFLLVSLASAPFFAILATHDQFSSDLGSGFLRFLAPRCRRSELFAGRYLAGLAFVASAHWIAGAAAALLAAGTDPAAEILAYTGWILLTVTLYLAALVALASIVSALCRTGIGALFLGMFGYVALLVAIRIGNGVLPLHDALSYLLPSALKPQLLGMEPGAARLAAASLPLYAAAYGFIAWKILGRRNF